MPDDPLTPTLSPFEGERGKNSWRPGPLYTPIRTLCLAVKATLTRARVSGVEHLPPSGGVLVVSNHLSLADPVILMAVSPRPLMFMAKEEIYRSPLARLILNLWGGSFPVRRGSTDVRAVREALALLDAGAPVVLFPEGTRRVDGLGEAHRGVGYLAARASKPVVPVGIVGTETIEGLWDLRRFPAFEVHFGEPFTISSGDEQDVTETIMRSISALLPPERRGAYTDSDMSHAR